MNPTESLKSCRATFLDAKPQNGLASVKAHSVSTLTVEKSTPSEPLQDNEGTMLNPSLGKESLCASSVTVESHPLLSETTCSDKSSTCLNSFQKPKLSRMLDQLSTISVKGLNPYWDESCEERSSRLWLPTETDLPVSDTNLLNGLSLNSVVNSWFSMTLLENQNESLPKIYSPSFMSSLADSTVSETIKTEKIRFWPNKQQKKVLNNWLGVYRFIYNETIWLLNLRIVHPNFMEIKKYLIPYLAEQFPWTSECPRAIKDGAVAEACGNVKKAIAKYKNTSQSSRVSYKSRKEVQQSFFLRNDQWSESRRGFNVRSLGTLKFSEDLPMNLRDGRVIRYANHWYVALPVSKTSECTENQGRLVSLDPGIRSFQTFFSDQFAGHLGQQDFQRIARLAIHLDDLLSRRDREKSKRVKEALSLAASKIRLKINNLISELHWKVARFLTDNFDVIILPSFETQQMVVKTARKLRKKSVRSLLTFSHYKFSLRLAQKCLERGKKLVRVCEAYTSKTVSWTGKLLKIGSAKQIADEGVVVDRDINGARGIFLRALVDSPILIEGAR